MAFSNLRTMLAGAAIAVSIVGTAYAQDAKTTFDARYAEMHTAMQARDAAATNKLLAPEYVMVDIQGDEHPMAEVQEMMAKMPAAADPAQGPKTTVLSATITGTTALVKQQMEVHVVRKDEAGTEMVLDVTILNDDTWVQRGGTWLLARSEQKDLTVKKDGEVAFHQAK